MKIKSAEIVGLNGLDNHIKLDFNDDLNIITGRNGSGKTNILKLIWYVISGNISYALKEISFDTIKIKTSNYTLEVTKKSNISCSYKLNIGEKHFLNDDYIVDDNGYLNTKIAVVGNQNSNQNFFQVLSEIGNSLFLPTFRRVESSIQVKKSTIGGLLSSTPLEASLLDISKTMTKNNHQFIASLGTYDVENFLRDKNAELTEQASRVQTSSHQRMSEKLKELQKNLNSDTLQDEIENIHKIMELAEVFKSQIMQPLDVAKKYILDILKISGIEIGNLTFGDTVQTINSNLLSAGEKQMLSFLAYNAFYQDTIFIIDEPELSLHVDWQRILFPTLLKQNSSNQFIVATHSPFIYAKYPDKELTWVDDRGDCNGEEQ